MPQRLKIPHNLITAYIRRSVAADWQPGLDTVKTIDPAYEMLFTLIDACPVLLPGDSGAPAPPNPASPEFLEILLIQLFSGSAPRRKKQLFIALLLSNPDFYERLMRKLREIAAGVFLESLPEIDSGQIPMKPDEELLEKCVFRLNFF
jgi:hypothetical protein